MGGETRNARRSALNATGLSPRGRGNPARIARTRSRTGVYPRVGGETGSNSASMASCTGLSPRGRGNHLLAHIGQQFLGSIPAWAGKPAADTAARQSRGVYPRVGGETYDDHDPVVRVEGLSPRGRGNPGRLRLQRPGIRSIPAWAGKPHRPAITDQAARVLSPRGRGNQGLGMGYLTGHGSIPAWAGKPGRFATGEAS